MTDKNEISQNAEGTLTPAGVPASAGSAGQPAGVPASEGVPASAKQPKKRIAATVFTVLLSIFAFVFLTVLVAFLIVQSADYSDLLANSEITQVILEDTDIGDEIVNSVNDFLVQVIEDIDVDGIQELLQNEKVAIEVDNIINEYIQAITEQNFDFFITTEEIIGFVEAIAPEILEVFDYEFTAEDYEQIQNYIEAEVAFEDFSVGIMLDDAGVDASVPWMVFSAYPVIVLSLLSFLAVLNIVLLNRVKISAALYALGITVAVTGVVYIVAGMIFGSMSAMFEDSDFYLVIVAVSDIISVALVCGIVLFVAGVIVTAATIVVKKLVKPRVSDGPAGKAAKIWRYAGIGVNAAALIALAVSVVLFFSEMPTSYF